MDAVMKYGLPLILSLILLAVWGVPAPCPAAEAEQTPALSAPSSSAGSESAAPAKQSTHSVDDEYTKDEDLEYEDEPVEEKVTIADPIEPFNRAMHQFNDKMYFWVLKPVARGYNVVVPEPARISVQNFFFNLRYPARLVSCILQTDFEGAATETGRFAINTVWGIGGLMDPAAGGELKLEKQDTDLGHTLGVYGVGHGFYIVWPFYGPSSPRDSVTIIGDQFLYAPSYFYPWYVSVGVWSYEKVNYVSLRIGEYESLIGAAIDPYVAIRNGYIQYRMKEVQVRKARSLLFKEAKTDRPATKPSETEQK